MLDLRLFLCDSISIQYRIKPEELYILSYEKVEAGGWGFIHS